MYYPVAPDLRAFYPGSISWHLGMKDIPIYQTAKAALVPFLAPDDARLVAGHEYFVDAGWR